MKTYLSVVLAVLMTCMTAHAAVNIDRTRLVFNERDKA
ncbi:fimbrial assembly protein, partial [Salmonella enterica]|nr:fimbrial assembly protein [Salmonella enterica]